MVITSSGLELSATFRAILIFRAIHTLVGDDSLTSLSGSVYYSGALPIVSRFRPAGRFEGNVTAGVSPWQRTEACMLISGLPEKY